MPSLACLEAERALLFGRKAELRLRVAPWMAAPLADYIGHTLPGTLETDFRLLAAINAVGRSTGAAVFVTGGTPWVALGDRAR